MNVNNYNVDNKCDYILRIITFTIIIVSLHVMLQEGKTALDIAEEEGNAKCVKLLQDAKVCKIM